MEAVYWYNVTPKDDITASTAAANSIHTYQAWIKGINVTPACNHTHTGIYKVGDAVLLKTPHGHCSTQFEKGTVTGVYSPHSILVNRVLCHIRDLIPQQRFASLEDDDKDESSENKLNVSLFFSAEPDDSSSEPKEMNPRDDNDNTKNKGGQVGTTEQEMGKSHSPLWRSTRQRQLSSLCHLDQKGV